MDFSTLTGRSITSHNLEETWDIARQVVEACPKRTVVALTGELGSGKTSFVKGMALALGIEQPIVSPTFTIVREYRGSRRLYHMDLYRMSGPDEILALGFDEYLQADGILAVEWSERAGEFIPDSAVRIRMESLPNPDERRISINSV